MPVLVQPDIRYKKSVISALKEYQSDPLKVQRLEIYKKLNIEKIEAHFDEYVQELNEQAKGIGQPAGYVPQTVYWFVEGDEYIGRVDIRHQLNDTSRKQGGHIGYDIQPSKRNKGYGKVLLQLAIEKAHELGIKDILMTCDADNLASSKVIQANGGVLAAAEQQTIDTKKFWIKAKN